MASEDPSGRGTGLYLRSLVGALLGGESTFVDVSPGAANIIRAKYSWPLVSKA